MTKEEIIQGLYKGDSKAIKEAIKTLEQESCDDCISRADALSDKGLAEFHFYEDYAKMRNYLKSLPSVTPTKCIAAIHFSKDDLQKLVDEKVRELVMPTQEWIPCSERLPDDNVTVTVSVQGDVFPEARYSKEDGWEWLAEACADYWEELDGVDAWMPLPKPYEAESEERQ